MGLEVDQASSGAGVTSIGPESTTPNGTQGASTKPENTGTGCESAVPDSTQGESTGRESASARCENTGCGSTEGGGSRWLSPVDVGGLSDRELDERLAGLGRQRSRVEGLLAEAAAEKHRRCGGRAAAAVMREQLNVAACQATADTELAAALSGKFPATLAALQSGEITVGHARVIARVGADRDHGDESELLEMAREVPVDLFARMTRRHAPASDDCKLHNRQRANRWASLVQDPDGSWRLSAYYDHCTGKRISLAFEQMVRTYRTQTSVNGIDHFGHLSGPHRRADALANLITGEGPHRRPSTTLLVIADYDTASRELRNLRHDDGLPVPADQIARIAANAKILPAVFNTDGDPLWLGRAQRKASTGQRAVLAARDGGCVNCATPAERCEPHHIEWWSNGGSTDIDNLALLCERCHHLIHDDGWELRGHSRARRLAPPPPPSPHRHHPARPTPQHNPILTT